VENRFLATPQAPWLRKVFHPRSHPAAGGFNFLLKRRPPSPAQPPRTLNTAKAPANKQSDRQMNPAIACYEPICKAPVARH